jgi:hypothetical protein
MKQLKIAPLLLVLLMASTNSYGQTLSLDECHKLAHSNYPKIKQLELIKTSTAYSIDNANKRYLPHVAINGQATYQSAVTELPFAVPGLTIDPIPNDQYRIYGEVNQPITDLFTIKTQKELMQSNGNMQEQQLEVDLYAIKERINQIYFGTLLIDAQLEQTEVLKKELDASKKQLEIAIENGVALKSAAAQLEIENIKADQRILEMEGSRKAFIQMLEQFIGQEIPEETSISQPTSLKVMTTINRPELNLFAEQKNMLNIQSDLISAKNLPHLGFFFQGGYGRPALNMLNGEFDGYYLTGLRLNWNLTGYYTMKKEKQIISINQELIDTQKETFEFNTNMLIAQQNAETVRIAQLIEKDLEIIELHEEILATAKIQLANGTITSTTYVSSLNAMDQARSTKALHEVQLLMAQQKIRLTTGN